MIAIDEIQLSPELSRELIDFDKQIQEFRLEGPLDPVAVVKLEEHFKVSHIYHSAGIEGNRLTLQETVIVLKDGVDISGKPLKDSLEVKNLGEAFDYLKTLADRDERFRESDIRDLHKILMRHELDVAPGEYRRVGVIISGSEHRPPEPIEVPSRMDELVQWINASIDDNPIIVSTVAHHELVAIHPFKDGNGRVSRLLMNLILMKKGYPICNIRRDDRPAYYDSLSFADIGLFEPLIQIVRANCFSVFSEYARIRQETKRMTEWAEKWGTKEAEVLLRRESREMELWQSRMRQVLLEFQRATDLLSDKLEHIELTFYDYKTEIDLDKYQQLANEGRTEYANAFSITFRDKRTGRQERFMFRYFRAHWKYPRGSKFIPLELNHMQGKEYVRLSEFAWAARIRIRDLYFTNEGDFVIRYFNIDRHQEVEKKGDTVAESVQWFFDDILKNIFLLK